MKTTRIRSGLYRYRGHEIELLKSPAWKDYQGLWRVWPDEDDSWYMHFKTLRAAKQAIDQEQANG